MAMGLQSGGGISCEINITPLIDVLLVLIIIFLVVHQSILPHGEDAQVPQPATDTAHVPPPSRTIVLQLKYEADNKPPALLLNHEPVAWPELRSRLFDIYKIRAEQVLFLEADKDLPFENIAEAIDIAHTDFKQMRVGLLTSEAENAAVTPGTPPLVARR